MDCKVSSCLVKSNPWSDRISFTRFKVQYLSSAIQEDLRVLYDNVTASSIFDVSGGEEKSLYFLSASIYIQR